MSAIYTCGRCGRSVTKTTRVCPHCGAQLAGIKCQNCGFIGSETDFAGDRCPKCRSVVYVNRQQSASAAPAMQTCKGCRRSIKSSDWTCPHCGYTQWGSIVGMGIFSLFCLSAILWGSQIEQPLCTWGGGIVGAVCLLITISAVVTALKTPRR